MSLLLQQYVQYNSVIDLDAEDVKLMSISIVSFYLKDTVVIMVLITVDGYVLSVNLPNIFVPFCVTLYHIILATYRDIPTLVRISLIYHNIENKTICCLISQPHR